MTATPADVAAARRHRREEAAAVAAAGVDAAVAAVVRRFTRGGDDAVRDAIAILARRDAHGLVALRACQLLAAALDAPPGGVRLPRRQRRRVRRGRQ
ncbi:hypothetical protein [Mycobacteroides abscessus]|uniref:hypothetical protein n=1 Tax=Mycobacteroides abscessus TaxID=36809 RepID=UPI0013FD0284|nr:hypothetical protein [Mycobacteroides abscessus]